MSMDINEVRGIIANAIVGATVRSVPEPYKARLCGWVAAISAEKCIGVALIATSDGPIWAATVEGSGIYQIAPMAWFEDDVYAGLRQVLREVLA